MDQTLDPGGELGNYWQSLPNAGGLGALYGLNPQQPQQQQTPGFLAHLYGMGGTPWQGTQAPNVQQMLQGLLANAGKGGGGGGGGYDPFAGARQTGKSGTALIKDIIGFL